ncbi:MAG: carbohydrate-binding protein, partial [Bacteroidota bacterium]
MMKKLPIFMALALLVFDSSAQQSWLEGSWGITFPVFGGERLNNEITTRGYDHRGGAQEIVDELPTAGHVITNLSYFAHSHYFTFRQNDNVNVAAEIHPSLVPTATNSQIIFDVLQKFKDSNKKIILYISTNYMDRADPVVKTAWINYYTNNFNGNEYLAYRDLIEGFIKRVKNYADGYWLDTTDRLVEDGKVANFIAMIKAQDPTALVSANVDKNYVRIKGSEILVDTDGNGDSDPSNYPVILHEPLNTFQDFTHGHITPLSTGAPPNSWGYEEFTIPNMIDEPWAVFNGKSVLKHGWFPIRERWHSPTPPLVFNTEQSYRYVRRITDGGASITFANTIDRTIGNAGYMMPDEMAIMKEVNRRLEMNQIPAYETYTRPVGARLVNEPTTNIALSGSASQTSTAFGGVASRAIDGDTNGFYSDGSVTHTSGQNNPYWNVYLGTVDKTIGQINIYNRTNNCCIDRLDDFTVRVINKNGVTQFLRTYTDYPNSSMTLNAGSVKGNRVRVILNGNNKSLSLAEVEVYSGFAGCASFERIEAENYNSMSGVVIESNLDAGGGLNLNQIRDGDWVRYNNVDLTCASNITLRTASVRTGQIELRLGSVNGTLVRTINTPNTGGWNDWVSRTFSINNLEGVHDLFFVFKSTQPGVLMKLNWFEFSNTSSRQNSDIVNEKSLNKDVTFSETVVYPNPISDVLYIESKEDGAYKIIDFTGKTILSDSIKEGDNSIDFTNFSSGVY